MKEFLQDIVDVLRKHGVHVDLDSAQIEVYRDEVVI
jgi:hypothetical protein